MKGQEKSAEILSAEVKVVYETDATVDEGGNESVLPCIYPPPYFEQDGCVYLEQMTKLGPVQKRLCNFAPYLVSQISHDDGAEITSRIVLGGTHTDGHTLPEINIDDDEFGSFAWVRKRWGYDCNLDVGQSLKEHIRFAIQSTAPNATRKTIYSVTGWKKINGEWIYLMPGNSDISVEMSGKLNCYQLKRESSEADIEAVYFMFEMPIAPPEIIFPLLSFVFLSPLNEFLRRAGHEPKTVLMITGKTGAKKSTLAALFLSFFGNFTASDLPLSFRDTANSILYHTFALKDVLTCIDDFHPCGKYEESKLTATAQSVMRAYGDRVGRGRLTSDSSPMQTRFPQGNAIITAEFTPDIGESGTARYFALELKDDSVDLDTLSYFQEQASKGVFQSCMFAYTEWLKKFLLSEEAENEFITALDGGFVKRRDNFIKRLAAENKKCHARIPEVVAWMDIGFTMLIKFLQSNKIVTDEKSAELQTQFLDILFSLAVKQSESIEQDKPTRKYIEKLFALIESGQISFLKKDMANDFKPPNFVGYEDDRFYYIVSDLAHKHVKKLCDDIGESFSVQAKPLIKMLAEEGLLDVGSKNTKQIWFGNSKQRVMCLFKDKAKAYVGME